MNKTFSLHLIPLHLSQVCPVPEYCDLPSRIPLHSVDNLDSGGDLWDAATSRNTENNSAQRSSMYSTDYYLDHI